MSIFFSFQSTEIRKAREKERARESKREKEIYIYDAKCRGVDDSTRSIQSDEIVSVGDIFAFDCSTGDGIANGKGQMMGVILSF